MHDRCEVMDTAMVACRFFGNDSFHKEAPMTEAAQQFADGKQKLAQGFNELIEGAEDLLRSAKGYSGEGADAARARIVAQVEKLKSMANAAEESAVGKARQIGQSTDGYVRSRPWQAVGIAAVSGLVLGALLSRR